MHWVRGPEHPLPDPLTLLETLTDACSRHAGEDSDHAGAAWPLRR
ncbi:Bifunctional DNA primase/polymerase OS=Streptomyces tendae OX=1932 GN=GUR47_11080 PE=4 SV=1 [Streptomyces tendae]